MFVIGDTRVVYRWDVSVYKTISCNSFYYSFNENKYSIFISFFLMLISLSSSFLMITVPVFLNFFKVGRVLVLFYDIRTRSKFLLIITDKPNVIVGVPPTTHQFTIALGDQGII